MRENLYITTNHSICDFIRHVNCIFFLHTLSKFLDAANEILVSNQKIFSIGFLRIEISMHQETES